MTWKICWIAQRWPWAREITEMENLDPKYGHRDRPKTTGEKWWDSRCRRNRVNPNREGFDPPPRRKDNEECIKKRCVCDLWKDITERQVTGKSIPIFTIEIFISWTQDLFKNTGVKIGFYKSQKNNLNQEGLRPSHQGGEKMTKQQKEDRDKVLEDRLYLLSIVCKELYRRTADLEDKLALKKCSSEDKKKLLQLCDDCQN